MKSVSKNYIYNTAYNILNVILPLATAPYLARILKADGVGTYAFYFAIAQWFALFAKLGLTNYGTRHLAEIKDNRAKLINDFSEIYVMQVVMTFIVTAIYFLIIAIITEEKILPALFGIWILSVAFDVDWFFFALEDFKMVAVRSCIIKLISTMAIFIFVRSSQDLWKYAFITTLSYSGGYVYLWINCKSYLSFSEIKLENVIRHIRPCLLLMIPVIALSIYRTMDKVMLGAISTRDETGLYEYAEKLIYALCAFISSLGTVMMPRMSNLAAKKDKETSAKYIEKSMDFIMFLSIGMCFGLLSISDSLIPLLYGEDFIGSVPLLNLLAVTLVFIAWGNVIRTQYVIPNKRDKIYISSITIGAFCNLIINALLIPIMGAIGACVGTIMAELSVPIYQLIMLHKELPYKKYLLNVLPFGFFGVLMFFACYYIKNMFLQVVVGALVYCILSFFYMYKILKIGIVKIFAPR